MEQSPSWKDNSHSASQEIPYLLWNPKVHYHVHKSPPEVPSLNQMCPVQTFPTHLYKIHSDVIFQSISMSSEWSLPFRFSEQWTAYFFWALSLTVTACLVVKWLVILLGWDSQTQNLFTFFNTKYSLPSPPHRWTFLHEQNTCYQFCMSQNLL